MKVLNIVRSAPDDFVKKIINTFSEDKRNKMIALYEGEVDWSDLVDEIFSHDQIICWW
jgi:predicted XRE-type DNA-binding protein